MATLKGNPVKFLHLRSATTITTSLKMSKKGNAVSNGTKLVRDVGALLGPHHFTRDKYDNGEDIQPGEWSDVVYFFNTYHKLYWNMCEACF